MKRQIGSLQRQAGKARRYQSLIGDLKMLETHAAKRQFDALAGHRAAADEELTRIGDRQIGRKSFAGRLAAQTWRPRVLITSSDRDATTDADARTMGAVGFISKGDLPDASLRRLLADGDEHAHC